MRNFLLFVGSFVGLVILIGIFTLILLSLGIPNNVIGWILILLVYVFGIQIGRYSIIKTINKLEIIEK